MKKIPNSQELRKIIGNRLKQARIEAGFSQSELGREVGLTHGAIGSYERGRLSLSIQQLLTLCEVLRKPVSYFLKYDRDAEFKEEQERQLAEKKKMERYNLDENLEFILERSIKHYLKFKNPRKDISQKVEQIMKLIEKEAME